MKRTLKLKKMKQILEILNPVHEPTVAEWMRITVLLEGVTAKSAGEAIGKTISSYVRFERLMQRWEELTRGKMEYKTAGDMASCNTEYGMQWQPALLRKEHFVCEVEKPDKSIRNLGRYETYLNEYNQALSKVWFEGFEPIRNSSEVKILLGADNRAFVVDVYQKDTFIKFFLQSPIYLRQATISDFITELDRYNRTAKEPIKINWTENFVKELIK